MYSVIGEFDKGIRERIGACYIIEKNDILYNIMKKIKLFLKIILIEC